MATTGASVAVAVAALLVAGGRSQLNTSARSGGAKPYAVKSVISTKVSSSFKDVSGADRSFNILCDGERVSEVCLGCVCEAISGGCNLTRGCDGDDCGMFRITPAYWADAGRPTLQLDHPDTDGAYQRCALDPVCAARTVRGYMAKFIEQDCNRDGRVDCLDYAAIHFNGGYSCSAPLDTDYDAAVRGCLAQLASVAPTP